MIWALRMKNCLSSLLTMRSRCLCIKRFSLSFKVFLWSQLVIGRGWEHSASNVTSLANNENSPAEVLPGKPSTPIKVPRFNEACSCMLIDL